MIRNLQKKTISWFNAKRYTVSTSTPLIPELFGPAWVLCTGGAPSHWILFACQGCIATPRFWKHWSDVIGVRWKPQLRTYYWLDPWLRRKVQKSIQILVFKRSFSFILFRSIIIDYLISLTWTVRKRWEVLVNSRHRSQWCKLCTPNAWL